MTTIAPFTVGDSFEEFSIKTTISGRNPQTNVISGKFTSDLDSRTVGYQGALMETLEYIIQTIVNVDFNIGEIPRLGKPSEYTFQDEDILVSFSNNNDYFIFRGDSGLPADREVFFRTIDLPETSYRPGDPGAPSSFLFVSGNSGLEYTVEYTAVDNFKITDVKGRELTYVAGVVTFDTVTLPPDTSDPLATTYRQSPYTELGVTVFGTGLPVDQSDLTVAEGVQGLFYTESGVDSTDLVNYFTTQGSGTLTSSQSAYVTSLIQKLFLPLRNSVRYVVKYNNKDYFSTNNGFANSVQCGCITIECNIT